MSSKIYNYSKEELQGIFDNSSSYAEVLRRLGMCQHGENNKTLKKVIKVYEIDLSQFSKNKVDIYKKRQHKISTGDILSGKIKTYQSSKLLKRLIKEGYKENCCERCGIKDWNEKELTFHLHHINGIHSDNSLNNLQILCPNCHSQTDNYTGKNVENNKTT